MSKLRLLFILSLVILAGAFIAVLLHVPPGGDYSESRRAQLIQAEDKWILQYDIINNQDRDIEYHLQVTIDDVVYTDTTVVKADKTYTYIHHIYPEQLGEGKVTLALYEEGKAQPIDQATCCLAGRTSSSINGQDGDGHYRSPRAGNYRARHHTTVQQPHR